MTYRITGIDPAPYRHLCTACYRSANWPRQGVVRMAVTRTPTFPCRDQPDRPPRWARRVLLLNHLSHDVAGPYRASHAIFISEGVEEPAEHIDEVPPVFATRVLSLRGFDADGMMVDAILTQPGEADAGIRACSTTRRSRRSTPTMLRAAASPPRSRGTDYGEPCTGARGATSTGMDNVSRLDADTAWAAFMRRDRMWDGRVIGAVRRRPASTASRAVRRGGPEREHVEFFASGG